MRGILAGFAALLAAGAGTTADAQTLRMMKSLDAPHYDGQRTTWSPTSDIVNMFQDALLALDWDGKTVIPYLAKSWDIREDGKLYAFKLRDDVSFCSGKKFTAADVLYTFKRLKDPETKAPYSWRAGGIKEVGAVDPYAVEYELNEPYSELLLQLPTPNRMNWKDPETDEWLRLGRAALIEADRAKYYMMVQKKVTDEHLWIPVVNVNMYLVSNKKLKGVRPHMLYQNTFYKGLDYSF